MSTLLYSKTPLVVNPMLAQIIGLNESIILQQINYWIDGNKKRNINNYDGHYWTYNSYKEWQKQFPFWSEKTVIRTIQSLESKGLILAGNYNAKDYDQTKWYTINYERLDIIENEYNEKNKNSEDASKNKGNKLSNEPSPSNSYGQNDHEYRQIDHEYRQNVQGHKTNCPVNIDNLSKTIPKTNTENLTDISVKQSYINPQEIINDLGLQKELDIVINELNDSELRRKITDLINKAITHLYVNGVKTNSGQIISPQEARKELIKISAKTIYFAIEKYAEYSRQYKISYPFSYFRSCLWNAITDISTLATVNLMPRKPSSTFAPNKGNFEQRQYSDLYYNQLYDNIRLSKDYSLENESVI